MTDTRKPRCKAPGCRKELPPQSGPGRPQEYCDTACRVAAWRARHAHGYETAGPVAPLHAAPEDAIEAVAVGRLGPSDEQAALTLMEARNLVASMRRLAHEARPELAWRFAKASSQIIAILAELFGDAGE